MASPQKEDGYTAIANAIVEHLARQVISADEWRVLWVILRKTYGWRKAEDWISLSQFVEMSGMKKQHVCRAIKKLLSRRIITQTGNGVTQIGNAQGWKYGLQKDFDQWLAIPKQPKPLPKQVINVTQIGNQPLPKQGPTKATITKENKVDILPLTRKAKTDAVKTHKKNTPAPTDLSSLVIPEYFTADDEWPELWADWQEHRRSIKKPLTLLSAKQQIKAMDEWGLGASIESLRQSLSNGWQGLFKPKGHDLALHDPYGAVHSDKERQEMIEWADKFYKEQEAKEKLAREEEERLYGDSEGRDQEGA